MIFGPEYFGKKYDYPVVYFEIIKVKRGYYEIELKLLTDTPKTCEPNEIMDKYVSSLEESIIRRPEYWLWSHRRWKHKRPENINLQ